MQTIAAQFVLDAKASIGEGPFWHEGALWWVDILANELHRFDPRTRTDDAFDVGSHLGAAVPKASGGFLLAVRDGFAAFDPDTGKTEMWAEIAAPGVRFNDGKCDRRGRFFAGTMSYTPEEHPTAGSLYRFDPDRSVTTIVSDVAISNGLGWSNDDSRMYYIDSLTHGVWEFDYEIDSGTVSNRRRLTTVDAPGLPDGMCTDAEGYLWVATWGGWGVRRYAPDGTLVAQVEVPVSQCASVCFGGDDLGDLYIVSATNTLTSDALAAEPLAGGIFVCRPGVQGHVTTSFAG